MSNFLQIGKMAVEEGGADGEEIGVARVVNLDDTPRVLTCAHVAAADLDNILGSHYSKGHEVAQLGIFLDGILVILLNVVRKVVNGDSVVLNVFHDQLLGLCEFGRSERVSATNDGDDIDAWGQALHELDVKLPEAIKPGVSETWV